MKGLSAFGFVINQKGVIYCYNLNNQILKIENDACTVFYELENDESSSNINLAISPENYLIVIGQSALLFNENEKKINSQKTFSNYHGFPFLNKKGHTICYIPSTNSFLVLKGSEFSFISSTCKVKNFGGILKFFKINTNTYAIDTKDKIIYSFNEDNYELIALDEKSVLKTNEYLRFYSENNSLWIAGTTSGVRILSGNNCQNLSDIMYPQYHISDVFQDHEGNILLSTFNHGVLVIPNLEIPDVLTLPEKQSIVSIHYDNKLGLIMGSLEGELIAFQNNQYKILSDQGRRPLEAIYSWTNFPYIIFDDGQIKAYDKNTGRIFLVFEGSLKDAKLLDNKTIYLALNTGVSKITIDNFNSVKSERIDSLNMRAYSIEIEPRTKNVYVSTSDGLKMLKANGALNNVYFNDKQIFANDLFSDDNAVYVSTKTDGILFFNNGRVTKKVIPKMNQKEIEIYKLAISNNKIYTNSSLGFIVFDMNGTMLFQLNIAHGFSTNKIFDFEMVDNQLWISHSKGFQKININSLKGKIEEPLIKIASIEVNDSMVTNFSGNIFNSDYRKFRFNISSQTLRNKESIKYYYKLEGYDNHWLVADYDDYKITYNALAPGSYTFSVKAENQRVFSQEISYPFTIIKPLYLRWWFMLFSVLIFIIVVYFIYRWQLGIHRKKSQLLNELNASKLTAIQSQMNPHFIFNSLNSIQDLVLKGDVDNSYTFITKFSNLVRRTLNYSDKDFVDFEQEIKLLELYLSLEKLRFKKDLDYVITIDNSADIMIPPLLIQPFIENALVHGLLHMEGSKKLLIHFKVEESLICTIEDNGVGRVKAKAIKLRQRIDHESFSGKAILKRFEILSNVMNSKFGYEYEDLYENSVAIGTRVTITIPVKHKF